MKDEDHRASSAFDFVRSSHARNLRRCADRVWSSAEEQVRWFVSWDVQWVVCGQLGGRIRRIFRSEWLDYRYRSRSRQRNRGFLRLGDIQRFTRSGECHLHVYRLLPTLHGRKAGRSRLGFVVVRRIWADGKRRVERGSAMSGFGFFLCRPRPRQLMDPD